jgi:NAD(P)-dependent dehydrogenase (short-subunit alcohol dehydrogenase family)
MARIFITGSADGLGMLAAKRLVNDGHSVVLHGRNSIRAREALEQISGAESVFTGDLSSINETIKLSKDVNKSGPFDAVIHNAGVYRVSSETIFAVNTLAPYLLTCLIEKPKRLIYLSSGMHVHGRPKFEEFSIGTKGISYSDSKLHVLMLSMSVARKWPDVFANAVDPGWVPTKMGGKSAPDDLQKGYDTQVWLAVSDSDSARVTGRYFFHQKERPFNRAASDVELQETFLKRCEKITGVPFPAAEV